MARRSLLVALLIVAVWTGPANSFGLAPEQIKRLDRGEVVVLDVVPPGGESGQGGTAMAVTHASPAAMWRVLVNYPRHRGLYPRVVEARILETDAEHALVRYVVEVGPFSFGFHVTNHADLARWRLDWRLDRARANDLFRDTWGYWQIEPHGEGAIVTYAMGARTVLPAFLTRGSEREGLVETIRAVRERAELEG